MSENAVQKVVETGLIAITDGKIVPANLDQLWRLSGVVLNSGLAPKGMDKVEKLVVAAIMGMDIGLSYMQSIQNIAMINGRPSLWGDAMLGLIQSSGSLESFQETFEGVYPEPSFAAVCVARRKGRGEYRNEFSIQDAKDAQLWGKQGPWQQYKKRMLRMRARGFTLRDGWSDVLKGLNMAEEAMDTPAKEVYPSTYAEEPEQIQMGSRPVYTIQGPEPEPAVSVQAEPEQEEPAPEPPTYDAAKEQPDPREESTEWDYRVGDMAYYKFGQGIGWRQVKIVALNGTDAKVMVNEDFTYNGRAMRGVTAPKAISTLRAAMPKPMAREEFINLRTAFTKEYLENNQDRIELTQDPKVLADLIFKAKKFFGQDYRVPGVYEDAAAEPEPYDPESDIDPGEDGPEVQMDEPEEDVLTPADDTVMLCDMADRGTLKAVMGLIEERGMDKVGVKLAMRQFVLHLKGENPINPFDVDEIGHIQKRHVKHFDAMLDSLRPAHDIETLIKHYATRISGFEEYVKSKMLLFPTPVEVEHWYLLSPGAINKIKLNLDEWAAEVLQFSEPQKEQF